MNGKDALLLVRLNGTLVDVSNLEGTSFYPFLLPLFLIWYSMEGVWEGFFTV